MRGVLSRPDGRASLAPRDPSKHEHAVPDWNGRPSPAANACTPPVVLGSLYRRDLPLVLRTTDHYFRGRTI